jgi:hypothetical protein
MSAFDLIEMQKEKNDNDFDLEGYVYELLTNIKKIHDENVENKAEYYNYCHLFSKEEIDNIAEAWSKCKWFEIS